MADQDMAQLIERMDRVSSAPPLRTVNGFGFRLSGMLPLPGMQGTHISAYWFVALFLPIIPLRLYVVSGGRGGQYRFYGSLTFRDVQHAYGSRVWWLLASAWLEGGVTLGVMIVGILIVGGLFGIFGA